MVYFQLSFIINLKFEMNTIKCNYNLGGGER